LEQYTILKYQLRKFLILIQWL